MSEGSVLSDVYGEADIGETGGVRQSLLLVLAISLITWVAIALVFWVGSAVLDAPGVAEPAATGLLVWAVLWLGMMGAIALAVSGGLLLGFWAWMALYPLLTSPVPKRRPAVNLLQRAQRAAVTEAEELLRDGDR